MNNLFVVNVEIEDIVAREDGFDASGICIARLVVCTHRDRRR